MIINIRIRKFILIMIIMFHLCIHDRHFLLGASSMIIARAEDVNWDELLGASEGASK